MSKIKIITDSASDILPEIEKELDIEILSFSVVIGNREFTSRVDFDNAGFYELMHRYDEIPKTSQITSYSFCEVYKRFYEEGYTDIVYVSINKEGSATYNNSVMAIEDFYDEVPEAKGRFNIYCYDGIGYTGMYGYPVMEAARMVKAGEDIDSINAYLKDILGKRRIYFGIYNLKYAAKSGRIPTAAALVGDALGVKPVMRICDNTIATAAKCRGEKKLVSKIVEMTMADIKPGSPYQLVYGMDTVCRDELEAKMTEKMGYGPTDYFQIGAEVASNAGEKVVGVIFTVRDDL